MNMSWIVSLICGALGGNIAGAAMKEDSLGPLGNSLAGILGGGIGAGVLQAVGLMPQASMAGGLGSLVGDALGGGVGGAILMLVVAFVKRAMASKAWVPARLQT